MQKHTESSDDSEDENTSCIFCKEKYSNSKKGEGWIMCASCKEWAHEACSGVDEEEDNFICDFCKTLQA